MTEKRKQEYQYIKNPQTGETMKLKTYSGKELFWEAEEDLTNHFEDNTIDTNSIANDEQVLIRSLETTDKDEEYSKLWEDDRL
jgi:hypothetical protein